jgi:hypothetical protein
MSPAHALPTIIMLKPQHVFFGIIPAKKYPVETYKP